jgi:GTP cyclohydrolase IA
MSNVFELPAHGDETARDLSPAEWAQLERNAAEILAAFGLDLDTPGTHDTPRRFLRALFDATAGYDGDPKLLTAFPAEGVGGFVVEGPISFSALCEHHALPFFGDAYVGYIAHEHLIGLSKLTRLVRLFAQRFSLQERIGEQIADTLVAMLDPHGVAVYLEAKHLCTQMRGVRESAPLTRTTFWRGEYESSGALRAEFFVACGLTR